MAFLQQGTKTKCNGNELLQDSHVVAVTLQAHTNVWVWMWLQ